MATGVFKRDTGNATLVTVEAACKFLRHYGASATTVAAVQSLQGAKPMTSAEISSLPSPSAHHGAANGKVALWALSGDEESDDEVSRSSGGSPAAGASAQPPAASSAPAVSRGLVSISGVNLEGSQDEDAPRRQLPAAGRAASSTQPSSAAAASKGLASKEEALQVPHTTCTLQMRSVNVHDDCRASPLALCVNRPVSICTSSVYPAKQPRPSVPQPTHSTLTPLTISVDYAFAQSDSLYLAG